MSTDPPASDQGEGPVLYAEVGSTAWPLVWGPCVALAGIGLDALTGARPSYSSWILVGLALLPFAALWVYARRRFLRVRLTTTCLRQADERLPVARIERIEAEPASDGDPGVVGIASVGSRVLGGSWTVPRKYEQLALRLDDDTIVLAWARDAGSLASALRTLLPS